PATPVARRQGVPFWNVLDAAGVPSTFFDLPCNYPPSPSSHGHHRCIAGMGTPDMRASLSTYQYFDEDGPPEPVDVQGGRTSGLMIEGETARAELIGPDQSLLITPTPTP